jgi:hypothetical protein
LGAPEIDGRGQTGDAAAYDNDFADIGIIKIGMLNHDV